MRKLIESMKRASLCLLAWLDPEKGYFPTGGYEVAHDTGRWWDAMLRMEAVSGISIPGWAEDAMYGNLQMLMDNETGFLSNRPDIEWMKSKGIFNPHNIREAMLALSGLVKYRNDNWAAEKGHQLLENLKDAENRDGSFDYVKISKKMNMPINEAHSLGKLDGTSSEGRALEAIMLFYKATKDPLAMEMSDKIALRHFKNTVKPDGHIPQRIISRDNLGHNHSYLGTLRGLLKYGLLTGNPDFINSVSQTYNESIFKNNISYAGWAPHDLGMRRFNNDDGDPEGDPASCGDVAQIALWLALENGQTELLDDVERLLRARLIPQQITGNTDPRKNGAWGIYRHPFGFGVILDVFAAVLHTFTDIYGNVITDFGDEKQINLHFDIKTPGLELKAVNKEKRILTINIKEKVNLRIRIPEWVEKSKVTANVDANELEHLVFNDSHLIIDRKLISNGSTVEITYDLPIHETIEKMKVSSREFKLTWKGDEVISCEPEVPMYKHIY
ncbi:MAG: hypothetical protein R3232_00265 [Clostridia bacterium]|nr:hypothetical protein [Clostridia bacterium]